MATPGASPEATRASPSLNLTFCDLGSRVGRVRLDGRASTRHGGQQPVLKDAVLRLGSRSVSGGCGSLPAASSRPELS